MQSQSFDTPILFLGFNRPGSTQKVFEKIRAVQPKYLFVAADGFRIDKPGEEEKCNLVRSIATTIDWDCELKTLFRTENLGCGKAVSEAITWFFDEVEQGIVLEDDCLPNLSFFPYCQLQLDRYKNNEKVMQIAGVNFQNGVQRGDGSYYFSKYHHVWGWASWRRAWKNYDFEMKEWPVFKNSEALTNWSLDEEEKKFWSYAFDLTSNGAIDTWDYQWFFATVKNNGLCLMPNVNLVSNIGFDAEATHTRESDTRFSHQPVFHYPFPDTAAAVIADKDADEYSYKNLFNPPAVQVEKKVSKKEKLSRAFIKITNTARKFKLS